MKPSEILKLHHIKGDLRKLKEDQFFDEFAEDIKQIKEILRGKSVDGIMGLPLFKVREWEND